MWDPGSHVTFGWPSASLTSRLIIASVSLSSASALEWITCTVSATFLSWVMWSLTPAPLLSLMKSRVFSRWRPRRLEATWDQSHPLILISGPEQQNWGRRVAPLFWDGGTVKQPAEDLSNDFCDYRNPNMCDTGVTQHTDHRGLTNLVNQANASEAPPSNKPVFGAPFFSCLG